MQFGHSYPDTARPILASPFSLPRPSSVFYPRPEPDPPNLPLLYAAAQPPYQPFQSPSPPYQPPYNGVDHPEPLGVPCDSVMPNLELNLPVAALVSQLERLTAIVRKLESRMDANERYLGDPQAATSPTSHCRTTAPLPAATAAPSLNLPPPAPPCSPDISGDEGELLDDDPPPLVQNQFAHDALIAGHSGWYQQPQHSNPNIDEQTLNPYYRLEAYQQWAVDQLPAQPPYTGFDLPEPPPYPGTEPLGMPQDPVTPDLEPDLPLTALVSQLERLTAIVRNLESRMDDNKHCLGNPHAATQPPPVPTFSVPYTAPISCPLQQPPTPISSPLQQPPTQRSPPCSHDIRYGSIESLANDIDEHKSVQSQQIHYDDIVSDRLLNRDKIGEEKDKIGKEEVLLDIEEEDGILKTSNPTNFEYVKEAELVDDMFVIHHFLEYLKEDVTIVNIPTYAPARFYSDNIFPRFKEKQIMAWITLVDRLGYDTVPRDIHMLRCRVNYNTLKFLPETEHMFDLNRSGNSKHFLVLQLWVEKGMVDLSLCDFVGTGMEKVLLVIYRFNDWPRGFPDAFHLWAWPLQKQMDRLCPLQPGEVTALHSDPSREVFNAKSPSSTVKEREDDEARRRETVEIEESIWTMKDKSMQVCVEGDETPPQILEFSLVWSGYTSIPIELDDSIAEDYLEDEVMLKDQGRDNDRESLGLGRKKNWTDAFLHSLRLMRNLQTRCLRSWKWKKMTLSCVSCEGDTSMFFIASWFPP